MSTVNRRNKAISLGISIALLLALVTLSYAYFTGSFKGSEAEIASTSGTLELTYTDCVDAEDCADISATLSPGDSVTKTFQIENTGTLATTYDLYFTKLQNTFINDELVYTLTNDTTGETIAYLTPLTYSVYTFYNYEILNNVSIEVGETHQYTLTITFLGIDDDQSYNENETFNLNLGIKDIPYLSSYVISLADTETTPDFSTIATDDEGVFAMEDDYGTSYYFRGAVENNYVYFAGYYWRIVRVNGDGTVRIIYDGSESAYANGTSSTDRYISTKAFNSNRYSPAYVGYMYGDVTEDLKSSSTGSISMSSSSSCWYGSSYTYDTSTGYYTLSDRKSGIWSSIYSSVISTYKYTCASSSITCQYLYEITAYSSDTSATGYTHILSGTYDAITENKYDSTIKTTLDTWYKSNLLDTEYESYLADGIFCNDRSVYSGDGYSVANTYYSAYNRLFTNKSPQLTCNQQNDAFTVDDTTYGNGDLTYPIGLITADELSLAGAVYYTSSTSINRNYYLYIGNNFWTMSPVKFNSIIAYAWNTGSTLVHTSSVYTSYGVRPVINLKADVLISSGDGTMDSPFTLELAN